jgi:hypothetical protein
VVQEAFLSFYDHFIADRADAGRWKKTQKRIHEWVSTREAQK